MDSSEEDMLVEVVFHSSSSSSSSEDSTDNETERRTINKSLNIVEVDVPKFDEAEFKAHFRLSRSTVIFLLSNIENSHVVPEHKFGREKVSAEKALLMCLWYLANQETFRQISTRFNVTQSTALLTIRRIVDYLVSIAPTYIRWPTEEEGNEISRNFRAKQGINGVIGAIDGSHINIKRPKDQVAYCNRKGDHSIVLQAVADDKKRFIDVYCGEPGSIHDARILKKSQLYVKTSERGGLPHEKFLLGDSAYPNLAWLVVPFKDNGYLNQNQKLFNYRHSSTRIIIENAFGLLKGRFRRLKYFDNIDINFIVKAVTAACVLHNICINLDDYENEQFNDKLDEIELNEAMENELPINYNRRQAIFNEMFNM